MAGEGGFPVTKWIMDEDTTLGWSGSSCRIFFILDVWYGATENIYVDLDGLRLLIEET